MGGLGIFLPSDVASYAYPASLLSSLPLQNALLEIQQEHVPQFVRDLVDDFAETVYPSDPDLALELSQETLQPQSKHQMTMAHVFFTAKRKVLLDHDYVRRQSAEVRRRFRYVLDSAAEPMGSSWLFALPNAGMNQRMAPREFQVSLSFRLLMPQFPQGHRCQCKGCTRGMDEHGYHTLFCRGKVIDRHQTVRDALYELAVMAGFNPEKDAKVYCLGYQSASQLRPADLKISGDGDPFVFDCVDVTVVSPFSSTEPRTGDLVMGKKANDAEEQKYLKYEEACRNASLGFKAFSIEVFGALGKRSMELLNRIRKAIVRSGHAEKKATAICYRKISIALQRGIVRQVLDQFPEQDFQ
jgi:hypothetical protein